MLLGRRQPPRRPLRRRPRRRPKRRPHRPRRRRLKRRCVRRSPRPSPNTTLSRGRVRRSAAVLGGSTLGGCTHAARQSFFRPPRSLRPPRLPPPRVPPPRRRRRAGRRHTCRRACRRRRRRRAVGRRSARRSPRALSEEAVAAFLGRQAAGLRDELGVLGGRVRRRDSWRHFARLKSNGSTSHAASRARRRAARRMGARATRAREAPRRANPRECGRRCVGCGARPAVAQPPRRARCARAGEDIPLCAACCTQLPEDADAAKVRKAYLLTIRRIHPDKLAGQPKVRERAAASAIFDALRAAHDGG